MDAAEAKAPPVADKLRRLGYPPEARLLIVHIDDLGMCQAANAATFEALEHGLATSTSLLVPCPWAFDAAQYLAAHPQLDVGVELALTSEWRSYRWRPLLGAGRCPSLVDADGFLPRHHDTVFRQADLAEARAEAEAQIQQAYAWGLDPTHLNGHMGTFSSDPRYLALLVELARKYRLPLHLMPPRLREARGQSGDYAQLDLAGLWTIDDRCGIALQTPEALYGPLVEHLRTLRPGVTELTLHAAVATPEVRAITPDWAARVEAYRLVTHVEEIRQLLDDLGIVRIGWRPLREAQRAN
jgi:chitin disaccharide deacetylase